MKTISRDGLKPMSRQYVHLSERFETAITVGKRHGAPVLIAIDARQMRIDGYTFLQVGKRRLADGACAAEILLPDDAMGGRRMVKPLRQRAQERQTQIVVMRDVIAGLPNTARYGNRYRVHCDGGPDQSFSYTKPLFYVCAKNEHYLFSDGKKLYCVYIPEDYNPSYDGFNWEILSSFDEFIDRYGFSFNRQAPLDRMPQIFLQLLKTRRPVVGSSVFVYT